MSDKGFIGYEYKEITVKREMESLYVDGYRNFGWTLEKAESPTIARDSDTENLKFKRDRKLRGITELVRLQGQFEACAEEIGTMERAKTKTASITALAVGVLGTVLMAGAVFAYLDSMMILCGVLAIPGVVGWIAPYWIYRKIQRTKTAQLTPLIEQKYDEIYTTCEKANGLLNG